MLPGTQCRVPRSSIAFDFIDYRAMPTQRGATAPAGSSYGPQPGVQIAGSVLTAVLLPGATPGSKAATSSNLNPTVVLLIDKTLNP